MDTQLVEVVGRNLLISELVRSGVEVATPVRDHGVDLVAYIDIDEQTPSRGASRPFAAVPIQIKASSKEHWSIRAKYERISNLLMVFIWNVDGQSPAEFYAMTYREALKVANESGYTKTASWRTGGYSVNKRVGVALKDRLQPFRMSDKSQWRRAVLATSMAAK